VEASADDQRDKLFYFFNGEFVRRNFPFINRLINPTFSTGPEPLYRPALPAPHSARQPPISGSSVPDSAQRSESDWDRQAGLAGTPRTHSAQALTVCAGSRPTAFQTQAVLTNGKRHRQQRELDSAHALWPRSWTNVTSNSMVTSFGLGWFKDRLFDYVNRPSFPNETGPIGLTVAGNRILGTATDYPRLNPANSDSNLPTICLDNGTGTP